MERDSRNVTNNAESSGAGPSWMDRLDQVAMAQRSSCGGGSPLDLPSAIAHEIQRSSRAPTGWQQTWRYPSGREAQEQVPAGAFLWQDENSNGPLLSQFYIPRFEEAMGPASSMHHQQTGMQEYSASAEQHGFLSTPSGFHRREDSSMRAEVYSPWIERVTQTDVTRTDVTPTPWLSLGISAQRDVRDVSCLASATLDMQADLRQSGFHCDSFRRRESTVDLLVDLCSDDEDLETHFIDDRRKKRMLSHRASAQRSRQRRQEHLDQLGVLFEGWASMDPTLMRDGNVNEGASSPSMSAGSPAGSRPNESDMDLNLAKLK